MLPVPAIKKKKRSHARKIFLALLFIWAPEEPSIFARFSLIFLLHEYRSLKFYYEDYNERNQIQSSNQR
jgi:hypothetical protein